MNAFVRQYYCTTSFVCDYADRRDKRKGSNIKRPQHRYNYRNRSITLEHKLFLFITTTKEKRLFIFFLIRKAFNRTERIHLEWFVLLRDAEGLGMLH